MQRVSGAFLLCIVMAGGVSEADKIISSSSSSQGLIADLRMVGIAIKLGTLVGYII